MGRKQEGSPQPERRGVRYDPVSYSDLERSVQGGGGSQKFQESWMEGLAQLFVSAGAGVTVGLVLKYIGLTIALGLAAGTLTTGGMFVAIALARKILRDARSRRN